MSVIASLIRAGVDPDLVADVAAEIAAARAEGAIQACPAGSSEAAQILADRRAKDRDRKYVRRHSEDIPRTSEEAVSLKVSPNDNINSNPHPNSHPSVSERDEAFDRLRKAYPKRAGSDPRKQALAKFQAAVKRGADAEAMIAGARAYARFMAGNPKFVKQLQNWITAECWTEDWDGKPRSREGPRSSDTHGFHDILNGRHHEPDFHSDQIASAGTGLVRIEPDRIGLPRQAGTRGRGPLLDLKPSDAG